MNLLTPRLRLRPIEEGDRDAFVAMNLDPEVMHYFASTFSPQTSDEHIARYRMQLVRDGFSFLTLEHRETGDYLGIVGMQVMHTVVPHLPQPAVEVGWRLAKAAQGQGYATEASQAVVDHAFGSLHLPELVAIIATDNLASQRVADKLGMIQRPELTFDHPVYAPGQPHARHFLYRLQNPNPTTREATCSTRS